MGLSRVLHIIVLPSGGEKDAGEPILYGLGERTTTNRLRRPLQYGSPDCKCSHRFRYHIYFIPSDIQPKNIIALAYGDSQTEGVAAEADWAAAKVLETYGAIRECVKDENDGDVSEMVDYFISSEIPDERIVVTLTVLSAFPTCLLSNMALKGV